MEMNYMIGRRLNKMSLDTATNWLCEVSDQLDAVNEQLENTDIMDVDRIMYLLEQQDDLQLCVELLDERITDLLEDKLNELMELVEYFK